MRYYAFLCLEGMKNYGRSNQEVAKESDILFDPYILLCLREWAVISFESPDKAHCSKTIGKGEQKVPTSLEQNH